MRRNEDGLRFRRRKYPKIQEIFQIFFLHFYKSQRKIIVRQIVRLLYGTIFDRLNLNNINNGGLKYQNHPLNAIYSSFNTS